jgi:hypothetical protein
LVRCEANRIGDLRLGIQGLPAHVWAHLLTIGKAEMGLIPAH